MGSRYLISGVQLGMIKGLTNVISNLDETSIEMKEILSDLNESVDHVLCYQQVGDSEETIPKDVVKVKYLFKK